MSPRPTPPDVDRVAASRAAVAARRARAAVKHDVATNARSATDVLDAAWTNPHSPEGGLRVRELLTSVPTLGPVRAAKVMTKLGIADSKRAAGLGVRQRSELWNYLLHRQGGVPPGRLVVLAGPTAVGKGSVSAYIRENHPEILLSISATTRPPRSGEVEGVHYYFVSDAEFDRMIAAHDLLEWAVVHNSYRYGTPRAPIDAALEAGKRVLLEIDLQGARSVRAELPSAILVFLLPPSWEELVRRLTGRGTEDPAEQARRLETARIELGAQDEFDYRVVNTEVGAAAANVVELMTVRGARP